MKALYDWSKSNYSHLPWRVYRDKNSYRTLVSEIMLQQTTVGTVLNHFDRFINLYPDIQTLSKASEEELAIAWKGLGYYRRARNLLKAAQYIVNTHDGVIPENYDDLIVIPGVGDYTANAILGIGKDLKSLALDANIERVLARFYGVKLEKGPKLHKELKTYQSQIKKDFKIKSYRDFHEALMDIGRVYCQARKVSCDLCPLSKKCIATKFRPLDFPIVNKKIKEMHDLELLRVLITKGDKVLFYKKAKHEWLSGQYELPTFILKSSDKKLKQYPRASKRFKASSDHKVIRTSITKYKILNFVASHYKKSDIESDFENLKFLTPDRSENISTASFKVLKSLEIID